MVCMPILVQFQLLYAPQFSQFFSCCSLGSSAAKLITTTQDCVSHPHWSREIYFHPVVSEILLGFAGRLLRVKDIKVNMAKHAKFLVLEMSLWPIIIQITS